MRNDFETYRGQVPESSRQREAQLRNDFEKACTKGRNLANRLTHQENLFATDIASLRGREEDACREQGEVRESQHLRCQLLDLETKLGATTRVEQGAQLVKTQLKAQVKTLQSTVNKL